VYLNDDVFFGNRVYPSDFFSPETNTSYLYWSSWIVDPLTADINNIWRKAIQFSDQLLSGRFGKPSSPRHFGMHGPLFIVKSYVEEMYQYWPDAFRNTSKQPFRTAKDTQLVFFYNNYVNEAHNAKSRTASFDYTKLVNKKEDVRTKLNSILRRKAKFICINDGLEGNDAENEVIKTVVKEFF